RDFPAPLGQTEQHAHRLRLDVNLVTAPDDPIQRRNHGAVADAEVAFHAMSPADYTPRERASAGARLTKSGPKARLLRRTFQPVVAEPRSRRRAIGEATWLACRRSQRRRRHYSASSRRQPRPQTWVAL